MAKHCDMYTLEVTFTNLGYRPLSPGGRQARGLSTRKSWNSIGITSSRLPLPPGSAIACKAGNVYIEVVNKAGEECWRRCRLEGLHFR